MIDTDHDNSLGIDPETRALAQDWQYMARRDLERWLRELGEVRTYAPDVLRFAEIAVQDLDSWIEVLMEEQYLARDDHVEIWMGQYGADNLTFPFEPEEIASDAGLAPEFGVQALALLEREGWLWRRNLAEAPRWAREEPEAVPYWSLSTPARQPPLARHAAVPRAE